MPSPRTSLTADFCDFGHGPIAFVGTCPICRPRDNAKGVRFAPGIVKMLHVYDLKALLRDALQEEPVR